MINEHRFATREAMLDALQTMVVMAVEQDIADSGQATLLLSGGSTPGPLYEALSRTALPWKSIQVALVDERWVAPDHPASNEGLLRRTLLQQRAKAAQFVPMKQSTTSLEQGAELCNAAYQQLVMPASLCLLGMGPDGHTASLFPGAQGLGTALVSDQLCAPIVAVRSDVTGEFVERMTLTPMAILSSHKLVLMFTGEQKWQVYEQAKAQTNIKTMPVSAILQQAPALDVFWAP